ncbi:MAG: hypothetical protein ACPGXY_07030, partial [Alphaproteobacteria bacterium]
NKKNAQKKKRGNKGNHHKKKKNTHKKVANKPKILSVKVSPLVDEEVKVLKLEATPISKVEKQKKEAAPKGPNKLDVRKKKRAEKQKKEREIRARNMALHTQPKLVEFQSYAPLKDVSAKEVELYMMLTGPFNGSNDESWNSMQRHLRQYGWQFINLSGGSSTTFIPPAWVIEFGEANKLRACKKIAIHKSHTPNKKPMAPYIITFLQSGFINLGLNMDHLLSIASHVQENSSGANSNVK